MKTVKLLDKDTKQELVGAVQIAKNPLARIKGLLGTKNLEPGKGLWLVPCNSVHTFGMAYAIDIVFLDKHGRVLRTFDHVKPNHLGPCVWKAHSALELPAGFLEQTPILPNLEVEAVAA